MIKVANFFYLIYQALSFSKAPTCRYSPTCSRYFLDSVEKFGLLKGIILTLTRLTSCHPFSKRPVYDPVPANE